MLCVEQHRKPIMGSDMKPKMNQARAAAFWTAWTADVSRLTMDTVRNLTLIAAGLGILDTRGWSKDELIGSIIDIRYPAAWVNEAIHVLYHGEPKAPGEVWDVCEWCNDGKDLAAAQRLTGAGA
jgi:hypothetical protein